MILNYVRVINVIRIVQKIEYEAVRAISIMKLEEEVIFIMAIIIFVLIIVRMIGLN